jgi:hypothetical protein
MTYNTFCTAADVHVQGVVDKINVQAAAAVDADVNRQLLMHKDKEKLLISTNR